MSSKLYNLLLRGWFRTKGRSSRQEYILRFLMMWIFAYLFLSFSDFSSTLDDSKPNFTYLFFGLLVLVIGVMFTLSVIQVFFVTHRRLHDLNASGWWQLVTFIPFGQLLMIWFIFFKGTQGVNRFGEVPNDESKSHFSLKNNILICIGITLLTLTMWSLLVILNRGKEHSINCQKIGMEYYKKGDYEDALKGFNLANDFIHILEGRSFTRSLEKFREG